MKYEHWTEKLFLERPEIFLAVHESGLKYAKPQAQRLHQVLLKMGVPVGGRLLDAPCGIGRHAVHLAARGWQVTGVDLVPEYIARARELAQEAGVSSGLDLHQGDLRRIAEVLGDEAPFNAVLNIFTSLGYWEDETDLSILEQFHELTTAGGVLLLETINRDFVIRHFEPTSKEDFGEFTYVETRELDLESSRVRSQWAFYQRDGRDLKHAMTADVVTRIYSPHELMRLLREAGWKDVRVRSGWELKPLSSDVYRQMAVARK